MHELSIAMSILDVAGDEARARDARLRAIHVRLGRLSGVVPKALQSAFELAREAYQLPDCELVLEVVPVTIYCSTCGTKKAAASEQRLACCDCDTPAEEVITGRELELFALEIEDATGNAAG